VCGAVIAAPRSYWLLALVRHTGLAFAGTVYFLLRLRRSQHELRQSEGALRIREQAFRAELAKQSAP